MPNQSTRLATERHSANMRILELENRCTGNRTVGSNPTLSANSPYFPMIFPIAEFQPTNWIANTSGLR